METFSFTINWHEVFKIVGYVALGGFIVIALFAISFKGYNK